VECIHPQVLVLRCIPICASTAWIRFSPRVWGSVIFTIFQEPLDVGHNGRGEYSHVECSASANELRRTLLPLLSVDKECSYGLKGAYVGGKWGPYRSRVKKDERKPTRE